MARTWDGSVQIEPSLYAADLSRLGEQVTTMLDAGARVFHFDVGDGHFVEPITMGPIVLQSISGLVHERGGRLDCHLMVARPHRQLEPLKAAGADSITFHLEANEVTGPLIDLTRSLELDVGVAFSPGTSVDRAAAAAEGADLALCMSIHPGLSGQPFMPESVGRIEQLRRLLPDDVPIQVDGGIGAAEIRSVRDAGATLLVTGSAVFWADDPSAAYRALAAEAGADIPD